MKRLAISIVLLASLLFAQTIHTGLGLTGDGSTGAPAAVDPAATPQKLTGSVSWPPGTLGGSNAATCSTTTISVPGALVGDAVAEGWPIGTFAVSANALVTGKMWVSSN